MTVTVNNGFFIPSSRLKFIETLVAQTSESCLIAIEGPSGIGKTTVLEELLTTSLPNANKCYLTATSALNEIQIRSRVIEQLFGNVLFDPEKPLLTTFLEFNHQVPLMLAIDNGHFLPGQIIGEILQVVAELKKRGHHMVALITYDQTQSKTLGSIDSALISHYTIPSLDYNESYQLLTRYFENLPSPSNPKIKRWIESANGNPIQLLAFDQKDALKLSNASPLNIKLWVAVVVVASLLFALGLYFYRVAYTDTTNAPATIKELLTASTDESQNSGITAKKWSTDEVQAQITPKRVAVATAEDIFEVIVQAQVEQQQATRINSEPVEAATPVFEETDEINDKQVVISGNELEKIEKKAFDDPLVTAKDNPSSDTGANDDGSINSASDNSDSVNETQSTKAELTDEDNKSTAVKGNSTLTVAGYLIDNQSLLALPSDKYVLQLTAVSTESTLEQYLTSKSLDPELTRIYKIKRNNADWLVVTYGVFDSIRAARQTAAAIDANAWAKSVSVIQQQIAVYQQNLSQN